MRFDEMRGVSVEHGFGAKTLKGYVKLRVTGKATTIVDQLGTEQALEIAQNLIYCAGRALYEEDFFNAMKRMGMDDQMILAMMSKVREAEEKRETEK